MERGYFSFLPNCLFLIIILLLLNFLGVKVFNFKCFVVGKNFGYLMITAPTWLSANLEKLKKNNTTILF